MTRIRTRVKFCGLVHSADVRLAVQLGVDAIGFVFYPKSPRFLTADAALELRRQVPSYVRLVGLFVNADRAEVHEVRRRLSLDLIQFHGDETPEECAASAGDTPFWRAVRMRQQADLLESKARFPQAEALLLDTFSAGYGGSGQSFDWSWVTPAPDAQLVMSGGLTPGNVAQAIAQVRPLYVDVSSGIQTADPRRKDPRLMLEFMQAVAQQDCVLARTLAAPTTIVSRHNP